MRNRPEKTGKLLSAGAMALLALFLCLLLIKLPVRADISTEDSGESTTEAAGT